MCHIKKQIGIRKLLALLLALSLAFSTAALALAEEAANTVVIPDNPAGETVDVINEDEEMDKNSGDVNENNGTVTLNEGYVGTNTDSGTVKTNEGTIENNHGIVEDNDGSISFSTNLVETNSGYIELNEGCVEINEGTIDYNDRTVEVNNYEIGLNNYFVNENYGTIEINSGTVNNGCYVGVNTFEGTVYNTEDGFVMLNKGTVMEADGTFFFGVVYMDGEREKAVGQAEAGEIVSYKDALAGLYSQVKKGGYRVTFNGEEADALFIASAPTMVELSYELLGVIKAAQTEYAAGDPIVFNLKAPNAEKMLNVFKLYLHNEEVAAENYTLTLNDDGTLALTFTDTYLAGLAAGETTFRVWLSSTGSHTDFTVTK